MSLNGLDGTKIKDAYEAAVNEAGGWFLLKYASRDELDLLERGNGGIVEIRNSIAQSTEPPPLFGFLKYRRRNVLIQFVPEDCSRLIKARATVHFTALCEHFAPYDTTFTISAAKELKDTQLSNACSLHTASGSTSSSTSSLRRRRLMEIAEEEEEEVRDKKRRSLEERPKTPPNPQPPVTLNADLARSPEASRFAGDVNPPLFSGASQPPSPAVSLEEKGRRASSQSARPDLYNFSSYTYGKPKVKLGPRPSVDPSGRPRTSTSTSAVSDHGPTAAIPAGFKATSRRSRKESRSQQDKTQSESEAIQEEEAGSGRLVASLAVLEASALSSGSGSVRPHTSSGAFGTTILSASAVKSPPMPSTASGASLPRNYVSADKAREKARLQRAMKLREEKKRKALENAAGTAQPQLRQSSTSRLSTPAAEPPPPVQTTLTEDDVDAADCDHVQASLDATTRDEPYAGVDSRDVYGALKEEDDDDESIRPLSASKADSGIGIDVGAAERASLSSLPDSHPTSPVVTASEIGDSTQASSLSEATDETVQAERGEELPLEKDDEKEGTEPAAEEGRELVRPGMGTCSTDDQQAPQQARPPAGCMPELQTKLLPISKFSTTSSPVSPRRADPAPAQGQAERNAAPGDGPTKATRAETALLASAPAVDQVNISQSPLSPRPGLRIPLSKFSTHQDTAPSSPTSQPLVTNVCPPSPAFPPPPSPSTPKAGSDAGLDLDGNSISPLSKTSDPSSPSLLAKHTRPRLAVPAIPPLVTNFDGQNKHAAHPSVVASLFDDDDLIEELQSATVQQAKPIMVAKSPRSPVPKRSVTASMLEINNTSSLPSIVRTVSNPIRGGLLPPGDVSTSSARALASGAAYLHKITQQQSADLRPKSTAKIGSGISQRIKALEKMSSITGSAAGTYLGDSLAPKERPSSTFFSVRRASNVHDSSQQLPSVLDRASSLSRSGTPAPSSAASRDESPETTRVMARDRSGSLANRLSMFELGNLPRGRPDSVQVTARIIRDPAQPYPRAPESKADPSDYGHLELRESPLVVDVKTASLFPHQLLTVEPAEAEDREGGSSSSGRRGSSLLERRLSKGRGSQLYDNGVPDLLARQESNQDFAGGGGDASKARRRSSLTVVKDFIKDRRGSFLGSLTSPSTDNFAVVLSVSPSPSPLALPSASGSPTRPSSSRPPSVHQTFGLSRRLSMSSRRSSLDQQRSPLSPSSRTDLSLASEDSGTNSPKTAKGGSSRTARFMRRLSSSLTPSRKSTTPTISPTVAEEDAADLAVSATNNSNNNNNATFLSPSHQGNLAAAAAAAAAATMHEPPTIVAFMGDVNVQFPDNLLWKRRTMCLDSLGYLILSTNTGVVPSAASAALMAMSNMPPRPASAVDGGGRHVGAVKRYHMTEFRCPYPPEMELQELPNSVVLDFADGSSGLQIACEDRAGQTNVLHILVDAHRTHTI